MKTSVTVIALLTAALHMQQTQARMVVAAAAETGTTCRGVQQLRDVLLGADRDNTWDLLDKCTHPLLFLPYKWVNHDEAVAYCKQDACVEVVKRLQKLPACTWRHIASDAENELLIAQRTLEDCGAAQ